MIRDAGPFDLEALAAVHAAAFDAPWSAQEIAALAAMPGAFALTAETGEGFVLVRAAAGEAEIITLAVAPQARGRGLGEALMRAAADQAGKAGAETLFLEVAADNDAALRLYRRLGFSEAGRRRAYYRRKDGMADALVLSLALNSGGA